MVFCLRNALLHLITLSLFTQTALCGFVDYDSLLSTSTKLLAPILSARSGSHELLSNATLILHRRRQSFSYNNYTTSTTTSDATWLSRSITTKSIAGTNHKKRGLIIDKPLKYVAPSDVVESFRASTVMQSMGFFERNA